LLFDPSFSPWNWILQHLGLAPIGWLSEPEWARLSVIWVTVWFSAPFFMVMFLASLKSVPQELLDAAAIDGAGWWQRLRYVTLPLMRNIITITILFSVIGSFAGFTIVSVLTNGGPLGSTTVLATAAFMLGIGVGHMPMGAAWRCAWCRSWRCARPSCCGASSGGGAGATPDDRGVAGS
jgi:multiple sugar transport system permease protein